MVVVVLETIMSCSTCCCCWLVGRVSLFSNSDAAAFCIFIHVCVCVLIIVVSSLISYWIHKIIHHNQPLTHSLTTN